MAKQEKVWLVFVKPPGKKAWEISQPFFTCDDARAYATERRFALGMNADIHLIAAGSKRAKEFFAKEPRLFKFISAVKQHH